MMRPTKWSGNAVAAAIAVLETQKPATVRFLGMKRLVPVKIGWVPMRKALDAAMEVLEAESTTLPPPP